MTCQSTSAQHQYRPFQALETCVECAIDIGSAWSASVVIFVWAFQAATEKRNCCPDVRAPALAEI